MNWKEANKDREKASMKAWYQANKEQKKIKSAAYYQANKEKVRAQAKRWKEANKEMVRVGMSKWQQANPDKKNATNAKYRAAKLQRTPSWLTKEDWDRIGAFYTEAQRLSKETGIKHEVDHIVPLQGETISGLHHPDNLQVITKTDNLKKGNR